jgi:hypothetical protein
MMALNKVDTNLVCSSDSCYTLGGHCNALRKEQHKYEESEHAHLCCGENRFFDPVILAPLGSI